MLPRIDQHPNIFSTCSGARSLPTKLTNGGCVDTEAAAVSSGSGSSSGSADASPSKCILTCNKLEERKR